MHRIDKLHIDRRGKVCFLDQAEESRLRKVMKARDEELQNLRRATDDGNTGTRNYSRCSRTSAIT